MLISTKLVSFLLLYIFLLSSTENAHLAALPSAIKWASEVTFCLSVVPPHVIIRRVGHAISGCRVEWKLCRFQPPLPLSLLHPLCYPTFETMPAKRILSRLTIQLRTNEWMNERTNERSDVVGVSTWIQTTLCLIHWLRVTSNFSFG